MEKSDYVINGISLEHVRNGYELAVIETMRRLIPDYPEFDNCPICTVDVYALSLSRIPSTYFRTDSDYAKAFKPDETVEEIVRYALYQVISQPKHA